jgi:hypothetical protein
MFSKSISAVAFVLFFVASYFGVDRCYAADEPPPSYKPITKEDSKLKPGVKEPQPVAPYKGMLAVDESTWDLDEIETNESPSEKHVFKITNKSKEPIKILNIKAKWEHISISYPPLEVKANDSADLNVKFTLPKHWGSFDHKIEIFTDEPGEKSPLVLTIKGNRAATSELSVMPREIHFGTLSNHERVKRKFVLQRGNRLPVKLLKMPPDTKELTTRIASDEKDRIVIEAELNTEFLKNGKNFGQLKLETDHKQYPSVSIRYSAVVCVPSDYLVPSILIDDLESGSSVERSLVSVGADALKENVAIERIEYQGDNSLSAELISQPTENPLMRISRAKTDAIRPFVMGELKITVKNSDNPIVIPVVSTHQLSPEAFSKLVAKDQLAYLRAATLHSREVTKNFAIRTSNTVKNMGFDREMNRLTDKVTMEPHTDIKTFKRRDDVFYQTEGEHDYESVNGKPISRIHVIVANVPSIGREYYFHETKDIRGKLLEKNGWIGPAKTHRDSFDPFVGCFGGVPAMDLADGGKSLNGFDGAQWFLEDFDTAEVQKVDLDTGKVLVKCAMKHEHGATGSFTVLFNLNHGAMLEEYNLDQTQTYRGSKSEKHYVEFKLSDPVQMNGIWIPRKFYGVARSGRYKFATVYEAKLENVELGKLTPADFEIPFPSGTQVSDYVNDEYYLVQDGGKREPIDLRKQRKERLAREKKERAIASANGCQ